MILALTIIITVAAALLAVGIMHRFPGVPGGEA